MCYRKFMAHLTSIVIPNRNYAPLLPGLFDSIAAQTSGLSGVEAVFADDASSDGSFEAASRLGQSLPLARFQAASFAPMGHPGLTRNAGAALARGDLLVFLDADDQLEPGFLSSMVRTVESGADVAYCDYTEHGPGGERAVGLPDFDPDLLATQNIATMGAIMRREVFEALGGFRDNTAYEDWDFWVRAAHRGFRFAHVSTPLYRYRHHGMNFSVKAQAQDGPAKAAIVANTPEFFPPEVRRWASGVLDGKGWAQPFGRGLIPREEDVRRLREIWSEARKTRRAP